MYLYLGMYVGGAGMLSMLLFYDKNEDDPKLRWRKMKMTINEDEQKWRRPKMKMPKIEDDQKLRRQKVKMIKN